METVYCPYTNQHIPISRSNWEHIIPKSLGGINGFEIRVDKDFNSSIGSKIDGRLANDPFWKLQRTEQDVRGHSGKPPIARFNTTYGKDKRKALVDLSQKPGAGIKFWDVLDRKYVKVPSEFPISLSMNIDLPIRFVAKVALGSGYYVHGESFHGNVDHRQLRDVMNIDPATLDLTKIQAELDLDHLTLSVHNWFHEINSKSDPMWFIIELCRSVKNSVVIMAYGNGRFIVAVGLLGQYLGTVFVPANSEVLLSEVPDRFGNFFEIRHDGFSKKSLFEGLINNTDIVDCIQPLGNSGSV